MHNRNKDGGIAGKIESGAKLDAIPRKSLTVIPIPGCRKPEIFEAETIDELIEKTPQSFQFETRKTDGTPVKENIEIKSISDLDLESIVNNNETLKGQLAQQSFLAKFQHEMNFNPSFKKEMEAILSDEQRKKQMLSALKQMHDKLKKDQAPVLDFLLDT